MISTTSRGLSWLSESTAARFLGCRSCVQQSSSSISFFPWKKKKNVKKDVPIMSYTIYEPDSVVVDSDTMPPLFITHGLLGSKMNWTSISKAVARSTGRKIVAFDARNHGDSPHLEVMDYHSMSDDVLNLADHLEIQNFSLMGHSMGGRTCMTFALKYPERIEKLIVVDMSPDTLGADFKEMEGYIRVLLSIAYLFSPKDLPLSTARKIADKALEAVASNKAIRDFLLTNLTKGANGVHWKPNLPILLKYLWAIGEFPRELRSETFEKPALFIRGRRSPYVPDKEIPKIQKIFVNAEIATMENSGHWPHADDPQQFKEVLVEFLNK